MLALPAFAFALCLLAQDPPEPTAEQALPTIEDIVARYEQEGLEFKQGPCDGQLGAQAHIAVPEGFYFLDGDHARKLLELNQNLTSGTELGALWHTGGGPEQSWWVFFEFSNDGYIKDDDTDIDADGLLKQMQEATDVGNAERQKRGWPQMQLLGWHKAPFYDPRTHNLTWSKLVEAEGEQTINWSTRLLGREGVMSVDLVLGPERVDAALPIFGSLLEGFEFNSGHKYAEFTSGDKLADYGLAALIAGGAGAVALKTGLFAKLWKLILIPILALGGWLKKFFGGRKRPNEEASGPGA
ncbi:MAG: DUF2167 domain-containing protein [Planctomycetes bacterium]|nr:DUF2167 domain-containing protein [Planctomycetota bacterium]